MRLEARETRGLTLVAATALLAGACHDVLELGMTDDRGERDARGGSGAVASPNGGTGGADGGNGGTGGVQCGEVPLTIDRSGWLDAVQNGCGITGPWYLQHDDAGTTLTSTSQPPYRTGRGMCASGGTIVDPASAAWGAGVGFAPNKPDETLLPWDAQAAGVIGFEITVTGTTGTAPLEVHARSFLDGPPNHPAAPAFPLFVGTQTVMLSDLVVPLSWSVANAGERADPTSIYSVSFNVMGGSTASDFDVCIASVRPITTSTLPPPIVCGSAPLNLDGGGFTVPESNGCGITGPWYWVKDGGGTTVTGVTQGLPPYRLNQGMCLAGSTVRDASGAAWGAGFGFNPNLPYGTTTEQPWDADAAGVVGFEVKVSGTGGGAPLYMKLLESGSFAAGATLPLVTIEAGVERVMLADFRVPPTWSASNAGQGADTRNIYAVTFEVGGGNSVSDFDFCIESVQPIFEAPLPANG